MNPRVAIISFHLESNAFSPVTRMDDFTRLCWEEGDVVSQWARTVSHMPSELAGFYQAMDSTGPWTPLPLVVAAAPPGGPCDESTWKIFLDRVMSRLTEALPVDAVYMANHGAATGVGEPDPDGALCQAVRELVGPDVPVVMTHDLHCNISDRTISNINALFPYRTNPHVDQKLRGRDAAMAVRRCVAGEIFKVRHIRLPLTPPSVSLLTSRGPYAEAISWSDAILNADTSGLLVNVAVTGGFVFSDVPHCGMCIVVTVINDSALASKTAFELAGRIWADRGRYLADVITIESALELARAASAPLLLADVADNPGGGGGGNTVWMLRQFADAGIAGVVLGVFVDADAVRQANNIGAGNTGPIIFNREPGLFAETFSAKARVITLTDGEGVGRRGIMNGRSFSLGATALVELIPSGMQVVISSLRRQLAEPVMLEMHGIDISACRLLIVKSRGHYRAGFDEFFTDDRIHDVDSDGLTTPTLGRVPFRHLTRPSFPLDADAHWPIAQG